MSKKTHTSEFLKVWAQKVIDDASLELKVKRRRKKYSIRKTGAGVSGSYMGKIDNTGTLRRSLEAALRARDAKGRFIGVTGVEFLMEEYGQWVDLGRGRTMKTGANKLPGKISEWLRSNKIKLRDPVTGEYQEKSEKNIRSATYLITRKLKYFGIDPTYFFSDPLDIALGNIQDGLTEHMMQDVEDKIIKQVKQIPNAKLEG